NENTRALEGIASALYDRFSISGGAFRYETDGWRPNYGIEHEVENLVMQGAVTTDFNMQAELRHRESRQGDLGFNFDPNFFSPDLTRFIDTDTARYGARFSPTPNSDILLSLIYNRSNELETLPPGPDFATVGKSYQGETQYIYEAERINLIAGFGYTEFNGTIGFVPLETPLINRDLRGYAYTNFIWPAAITWTLGIAGDDFEDPAFTVDRVSPKAGVRWDITSNLSLRGAVFRWVKPALAAGQT